MVAAAVVVVVVVVHGKAYEAVVHANASRSGPLRGQASPPGTMERGR